jgi:hypothetical protein
MKSCQVLLVKYLRTISSLESLTYGRCGVNLAHPYRSIGAKRRSEMSILLLTLRRDKPFLLTSAYSFPCSSDYRIMISHVLSLSRSRSLAGSALLASQLPSQSERIYTEQFFVYPVRSPARYQTFQLQISATSKDPKGYRPQAAAIVNGLVGSATVGSAF